MRLFDLRPVKVEVTYEADGVGDTDHKDRHNDGCVCVQPVNCVSQVLLLW